MAHPLHALTSETKMKLFRLLVKPSTPDFLAESLGITRQAVDKHLKEFSKYGIIRKMWLLTDGRPKVEYVASNLGQIFYGKVESLISEYREKGKEELGDQLKDLDMKLIGGKLSLDEYKKQKQQKVMEFSWFSRQG